MNALIVSSTPRNRDLLGRMLGKTTSGIFEASTYRQALAKFGLPDIGLVICERDLLDGSWKDMLEAIRFLPAPPLLIVTSQLADDYLWAEVLNLGGYDVLAQPFDSAEVRRVSASARDCWIRQSRSRATAFLGAARRAAA